MPAAMVMFSPVLLYALAQLPGLPPPPQDTGLALDRPVTVAHAPCTEASDAAETCIDGVCYTPACTAEASAGTVVDGDTTTSWASPVGQQHVNITVDLGGLKEVASVTVTFGSVFPESFVIERSVDGADDDDAFEPWNYYSASCEETFNKQSDATPEHSADVICRRITQVADAGSRVARFVILGANRPFSDPAVSDYRHDRTLQQFSKATRLRLRLVRYETASQSYDVFGASTPIRNFPFYVVEDIAVTGRCECNGHASACVAGACVCEHGTTGPSCEVCDAQNRDRGWQPGVYALESIGEHGEANACRPCNCSRYADTCEHDQTTDVSVCVDCRDNTVGGNCEHCVEGFYKLPLSDDADGPEFVCESCGCNLDGALPLNTCDNTGRCACKANVVGNTCDTCAAGHRSLDGNDPDGCTPCDCSPRGTLGDPTICDTNFGCRCRGNYTGFDCAQCVPGLFRAASSDQDGLEPACVSCDAECGDRGCNSLGVTLGDNCLSCRNVEYLAHGVSTCLASCPEGRAFYPMIEGTNRCGLCHNECDGCDGPRDDQCHQCKRVMLNGRCLRDCPTGHYADENSECQECDGLCTECWGPSNSDCGLENCTYYHSDGACVQACDDVTQFPGSDGDTENACLGCHTQCLGCTGTGADQCRDCRNVGRADEDGVRTCISGCHSINEHEVNGTCLLCDPLCSEGCTGPDSDECVGQCAFAEFDGRCLEGCPFGTRIEPESRVCFAVCPAGTVADTDNERCIRCDNIPGCLDCEVVGETDGTGLGLECQRCDSDGIVSSSGRSCTAGCASMEYVATDGVGAACRACGDECVDGCSGAGNGHCQACRAFTHAGVCTSACPERTFGDGELVCQDCSSECSAGCSGAGQLRCNRGGDYGTGCLHLSHPQQGCVASCPDGSLANGASSLCLLCHASCGTCAEADVATACISCLIGSHLDEQSSDSTGSCSLCHPQCGGDRSCSGPLASQCTAGCIGLSQGEECVAQCSPNSFSLDGSCHECDDQCNGCTGAGPEACTRCRQAMFGDRCVEACPANHFENADRSCIQCHGECDPTMGCTGSASAECQQCLHVGSFDGDCVAECPSGEFQGTGTQECRQCDALCQTCEGPSATDCTSCAGLSHNGQCVGQCPVGWFSGGNMTCSRCNEQCDGGCYGPTAGQCTACSGSIHRNTCVSSCPTTHFSNSATSICEPCDLNCDGGCTGSDSSDCVRCAIFSDSIAGCVAECPEGRFLVNQTVCVETCPESQPFFPDPRIVPTTPTCHTSCAAIADSRLQAVSSYHRFRCTTERVAGVDSNNAKLSTDEDSSWMPVVIGVSAFVFLVIVTGLTIIGYRRKQSIDLSLSLRSGMLADADRRQSDPVSPAIDSRLFSLTQDGQHLENQNFLHMGSPNGSSSPDLSRMVLSPVLLAQHGTNASRHEGGEVHTWL